MPPLFLYHFSLWWWHAATDNPSQQSQKTVRYLGWHALLWHSNFCLHAGPRSFEINTDHCDMNTVSFAELAMFGHLQAQWLPSFWSPIVTGTECCGLLRRLHFYCLPLTNKIWVLCCVFSWRKIVILDSSFVCCLPRWRLVSIGYGNGLAPKRPHVIGRSNKDAVDWSICSSTYLYVYHV